MKTMVRKTKRKMPWICSGIDRHTRLVRQDALDSRSEEYRLVLDTITARVRGEYTKEDYEREKCMAPGFCICNMSICMGINGGHLAFVSGHGQQGNGMKETSG